MTTTTGREGALREYTTPEQLEGGPGIGNCRGPVAPARRRPGQESLAYQEGRRLRPGHARRGAGRLEASLHCCNLR